ncbi:MAG TPA: hypothetical protein VK154_15455 [Chitinophagales bacterium]|nr:hypothetical protein [Chitinophagales bacterium]
MLKENTKPSILQTRLIAWALIGVSVLIVFFFSLNPWQNTLQAQTVSLDNPWQNMGTDVTQICTGGSAATDYEWGVTYNNASPVLRVTCNTWNTGQRVCTYPPYPTGDSQPFTWGGSCWFWGTNSTWDDGCSAYHSYYTEDATGRYNMSGGNGCNSLPTVYRRRL